MKNNRSRWQQRIILGILLATVVVGGEEALMSQASESAGVKNIVLVHGGFVDGSGWKDVHTILKRDGFNVTIVQNPTNTLAEDVVVTKRALAAQNGPSILVGHSYGGVVITEAGNDANVAGLVYIAAFAPDAGESVSSLIKDPAPGAPVPPILPPQDGLLFLDRSKFHASFAADLSADLAGDTAAAVAHYTAGLRALEAAGDAHQAGYYRCLLAVAACALCLERVVSL